MTHNQQEKDVSLGALKFRIRKFTPEVACFWAMRLFGNLLSGVIGQGKFSMENVAALIASFVQMERKDHAMLQRDALSSVYVIMDSGVHPLLNSEGFYTVPDVPAPSILALTIMAFEFSMRDFFDPALLATLAGAIPGLSSALSQNGSEASYTSP
jgi:hypothetical protein